MCLLSNRFSCSSSYCTAACWKPFASATWAILCEKSSKASTSTAKGTTGSSGAILVRKKKPKVFLMPPPHTSHIALGHPVWGYDDNNPVKSLEKFLSHPHQGLLPLPKDDWQIGRNKMFMRRHALADLADWCVRFFCACSRNSHIQFAIHLSVSCFLCFPRSVADCAGTEVFALCPSPSGSGVW